MAGISKYEKYKPSGIDWIGDVPAHWQVKRLKNLAANVSSKSPEISDDDFLQTRVSQKEKENWKLRTSQAARN